ncbi:MAG TPA: FadR/GntR family transcriptional regulator [Myxococcota bacterium]|jgi:GntR family transcriptional repressor for pyruvate dehydrogenase complex|nr:FadR/GntR family transcriptional regulator [Myxococcota bacterium]
MAAPDPDALAPLGSARRPQEVFEQLRIRILSGALPAGSRLPNERELSGTLGVNRASLREALKRLEYLELVEVRHGQGTFVREVSGSSALQVVEGLLHDPRTVTVDLLRQILDFRRHVALHVAELAARNRSDAQLARAHALLADEEVGAADPARALALDVEMNALLGEASGNLMYRVVTNLFTKLVARLGPLYYNAARDHRRSLETHRALLAAIERRDPSEARRIVEVMLDYSEAAILREAERLQAAGFLGPTPPKAAP